MLAQYRIWVLIHQGEELADPENFQGILCTDYSHPRYEQARRIDDERCEACQRKHQPPILILLKGGKA